MADATGRRECNYSSDIPVTRGYFAGFFDIGAPCIVDSMLLCKDSAPDQNNLVLKFLDWALKKGQAQAKELDYVPLPETWSS